jgi:hypothetical protein
MRESRLKEKADKPFPSAGLKISEPRQPATVTTEKTPQSISKKNDAIPTTHKHLKHNNLQFIRQNHLNFFI